MRDMCPEDSGKAISASWKISEKNEGSIVALGSPRLPDISRGDSQSHSGRNSCSDAGTLLVDGLGEGIYHICSVRACTVQPVMEKARVSLGH